jgi:hypothetical protein
MDAKRVQLLLAQAAVDAALEAPSAGGAKNAAVVATEKRLARERCAMSCFRNYWPCTIAPSPHFRRLTCFLHSCYLWHRNNLFDSLKETGLVQSTDLERKSCACFFFSYSPRHLAHKNKIRNMSNYCWQREEAQRGGRRPCVGDGSKKPVHLNMTLGKRLLNEFP